MFPAQLIVFHQFQQSFKNRVDTSYVVSQERLHKHRAMAIIKPLANFTGEYACMVQTFASIDRKSAKLKIIGKHKRLKLNSPCTPMMP